VAALSGSLSATIHLPPERRSRDIWAQSDLPIAASWGVTTPQGIPFPHHAYALSSWLQRIGTCRRGSWRRKLYGLGENLQQGPLVAWRRCRKNHRTTPLSRSVSDCRFNSEDYRPKRMSLCRPLRTWMPVANNRGEGPRERGGGIPERQPKVRQSIRRDIFARQPRLRMRQSDYRRFCRHAGCQAQPSNGGGGCRSWQKDDILKALAATAGTDRLH